MIDLNAIIGSLRVLNGDYKPYGFKIPEWILEERARNIATVFQADVEDLERKIVALTIEKERLIYWLLRAMEKWLLARPPIDVKNELAGALACLSDIDYEFGGDRARRILDLGEPGTS